MFDILKKTKVHKKKNRILLKIIRQMNTEIFKASENEEWLGNNLRKFWI